MHRFPLFALLCASACTLPGASDSATPRVGSVDLPSGVGVSQGAIVGGTSDTGDPSVVMLIAQVPGSQMASLCTGEVISSHVVLTAAHCVDPSVVGQGNQFQIFLGDNLNDQSQNTNAYFLDVKSTTYNMAFDVNNLQGGNDVAVAVTTQAIPRTPLLVNQSPLGNSDVGSPLRLVGFGVTGTNQTTDTAGVKRQTSSPLSYIDTQFLGFGDAQHNTCEGDSGGPAFMTRSGVEVIVGITSFGDQSCTQGGADTRVDSYWTSFIQPQIIAAGDTVPSGQTTTTPDGGTTSTSGTDGGSTSSGGDGGSSSSATGRAVGQSCTDSSQCTSGICTEGSDRFCTAACDLSNVNSCPADTHCAAVGGSPYCVLTPHASGCSAAASTSPAAGALPVFGLLLLLGGGLLRRRIGLFAR